MELEEAIMVNVLRVTFQSDADDFYCDDDNKGSNDEIEAALLQHMKIKLERKPVDFLSKHNVTEENRARMVDWMI